MGKNVKGDSEIFSPVRFGAALKNAREHVGITSADKLSKIAKEKTGVTINRDTIYKYERGEREPDITNLVAMFLSMFGDSWADELRDCLLSSMPSGRGALFAAKMGVKRSWGDLKDQYKVNEAQHAFLVRQRGICILSDSLCVPYSEARELYDSENGRKNLYKAIGNDPSAKDALDKVFGYGAYSRPDYFGSLVGDLVSMAKENEQLAGIPDDELRMAIEELLTGKEESEA